ncbi:unnamed protein product [Auanema sp. JU1783]|nr:unnamed protein product [Auanema sp. JU1783]
MIRTGLKRIAKVFVGGCVLVTFSDSIGHPAVVCGNSMYPTLDGSDARWWKRDFVWLSPWAGKNPQISNIHTFTSPRDPTNTHIKRITALENDVIKVRDRNELMIIPKGCCWMESDNPSFANDSNIYGPVSRGLIKSKATHIIWPPHRWQKI